jgi:hypothetical protein
MEIATGRNTTISIAVTANAIAGASKITLKFFINFSAIKTRLADYAAT